MTSATSRAHNAPERTAAGETKCDVSVIIVSWNAKELLFECLESLERERGKLSLEIIVVDNASSDGTPEAVTEQFSEVRLVQNNSNRGFAAANNIGIRQAAGKYLCLINSDVVVHADCLQKMVDFMDSNPRVGILGPKTIGANGTIQRSSMRFPSLWNQLSCALALDALFPRSRIFGGFMMRDFRHNYTREVDILNGCFWMARREAVNQVGLLDEQFFMYGEDMDWCRRFSQAGWGAVFYAEASATHYGGGSSANAPTRFHVEQKRANLQYWKKHHGSVPAFLYSSIIGLHELMRTLGYGLVYLVRRSRRAEASFKVRRSLACIRWLITCELTANTGIRWFE